MPRGRHTSSGDVGKDLAAPLAALLNVMDEFFDAYAFRREAGDDQRFAVRQALIEVVPDELLSDVIAMLSGQIDRKLSVGNREPFDGRKLCSDLIMQGDDYWERLRADSSWGSDGGQSAADGTNAAPGWWQGPDGQWNAPSVARPPVPSLEVQNPEDARRTESDADKQVSLCPNGHSTSGTPFCPMCGVSLALKSGSPVAGSDESTTVSNSLHDFEDGTGPVPAHMHPNGGGWVADTSTVDATAFVGPAASVFEQATVAEQASVDGTAWVLGKAKVEWKREDQGRRRDRRPFSRNW